MERCTSPGNIDTPGCTRTLLLAIEGLRSAKFAVDSDLGSAILGQQRQYNKFVGLMRMKPSSFGDTAACAFASLRSL